MQTASKLIIEMECTFYVILWKYHCNIREHVQIFIPKIKSKVSEKYCLYLISRKRKKI